MKLTSRVLLFSVLALIIFGCTANNAIAKNENSATIQEKSNTGVPSKMNALLLYHTKTGHTLKRLMPSFRAFNQPEVL